MQFKQRTPAPNVDYSEPGAVKTKSTYYEMQVITRMWLPHCIYRYYVHHLEQRIFQKQKSTRI